MDLFWGRKCLKMSLRSSFWALIWTKIVQNRQKTSLVPPQGPPGTPKAAQRPPSIDLGALWAPFWSLLGCIIEPTGGSILGAMLPSFLAFLSCFFPLLLSCLSSLSFLPPAPSPPRNKETKKPRTQATKKLTNPETNSSWVGGCPR